MVWATVSSWSCLLHSVPPTLQQATTDPRLCWRLLDTHGQVWVSHLWSHCSFFLGPGAHKVLFVPSKSLFPQSCVSSGSSMVGLMATSSKRAYAIPRSTAPRAPAPAAVHCWPVPLQETHTVLSQSLWGLWVLLCTRFVWALWASLASMGFDYKCDFAPPIALLGLLLYPWTWSISLKLLQRHTATVPAPCSYVFMIIQMWNYAEVHHQMIAFSKFLILLYCCCFVTKSCLSLCNPMDCSPPGSCVHGMFQARILEQMATSYSRRSSQPRDWLHVSCISCISKWILYH